MGISILTFFYLSLTLWAADPINQGVGGTYVPAASVANPTVQQRLAPTNIGAIPTPDTAPPPAGIPAPSSVIPTVPSLGQYRNTRGEVNLKKMFLDRYKQSVVRVTARDLAGNELSRAMGVGVGKSGQYIATPLSLVLGNSQQWADRIEITHAAGNRYFANVAYIDEERNIVLLAPEASPSPIPMVREMDERPQVDVFFFSFEEGPNKAIEPKIYRGNIAGLNLETGLLSIASQELNERQIGSGLINTQGELVGMLLPDGRGVLTSTIQKIVLKAQKATPFEPRLVGTILGRGILVDAKSKEKSIYTSINAALEAIKKGEAPRADPSRYSPAKNRSVAPTESDKVVIKVMPGVYREPKPISLEGDISLSGSGPDRTKLQGTDPSKPILLIQKASNVSVSGFQFIPSPKQSAKAPSVILNQASSVTLLGNYFQAPSGVTLWALDSRGVKIFGNTFAKGAGKALACDTSDLHLEANAFLGAWSTAINANKGCELLVRRSLFLENKISIQIASTSRRVRLERNTFVQTASAIRAGGDLLSFRLLDNLFYETENGLAVAGKVNRKGIGRNAVWKAKFTSNGRVIPNLDLVRTEPRFEDREAYDFRLRPGQGQIANAKSDEGADLGAFQRQDYLGPYSQNLVRSMAPAVGDLDLPASWGFL